VCHADKKKKKKKSFILKVIRFFGQSNRVDLSINHNSNHGHDQQFLVVMADKDGLFRFYSVVPYIYDKN